MLSHNFLVEPFLAAAALSLASLEPSRPKFFRKEYFFASEKKLGRLGSRLVPCSHPVCSMAIYKHSRLVPKSGASPFSMSNACTSLQEGMVRCLVLESTISNVHASLKVATSFLLREPFKGGHATL